MISENKIHNLLEDDSFRKFVVAGQFAEKWNIWLQNNPGYNREFKIASKIIENIYSENQAVMSELKQRDIKNRIKESLKKEIENKLRHRSFIWKAAVVSLILVGSLAIALLFPERIDFREQDQPVIQKISKNNPKGIKSIITFSDGSKAYLNAESSIKYPQLFSGNAREVELVGEAYFEINKDENHPFIIHTDQVQIKVLGTRFNVNAYPENDQVKVALVSGKVALNSEQGDQLMLSPSEMFIYSTLGDRKYSIESFNSDHVVGWKDGILSFHNESLQYVFQKMERWYGVNILYDKNKSLYKDWMFTGKFENRSLEYILNTMNQEEIFDFKIENDKVIIK